MKRLFSLACGILAFFQVETLTAQVGLSFSDIQVLTNQELLLTVAAPSGQFCRLESSADLARWTGLATLAASGATQYTDSAAPFSPAQFYRANQLAGTNIVTGDHLATAEGEVTFHPVYHAGLVLTWGSKVLYCDPTGAARFQGLPRPDFILVTHDHSDHFDPATLSAVKGSNTVILAPAAVCKAMPATLKSITTVLANGDRTDLLNLSVEAVPAYNLTSSFHPKGVGNGYILTLGGKRIYISGDTEDTPELRAMQNIDIAFVCMNLPYTMSVDKAVSAVRQFRPKVVYIYHYQGYTSADVNRSKQSIGTDRGVEVRLRKWY